MAKQETNFIEIILRSIMLGMTIYDDDDGKIVIKELNYDPKVQCIYIEGQDGQTYKMNINEQFDFEYNQFKKIKPFKNVIGKRTKRN